MELPESWGEVIVAPLGEVVRAWRLHRGLKSYEVAQAAGLRPEQYSRIESGKNEFPRQETLEKVAEALGVSWFGLLSRTLPISEERWEAFTEEYLATREHYRECPRCQAAYRQIYSHLMSPTKAAVYQWGQDFIFLDKVVDSFMNQAYRVIHKSD